MRGSGEVPTGRVTLGLLGQRVRAEISTRESTRIITVLKGSNNPTDVARLAAEARRFTAEGQTEGEAFQITPSYRYHPRRAEVAELRSAYLAAFAALGYTYILAKELDQVRAQIREPDQDILPFFSFPIALESLTDRFLLAASGPVPCLVVAIGRSAIILPEPGAPDPYAAVRGRYAEGEQGHFTGVCIPWPTRLVLGSDRVK